MDGYLEIQDCDFTLLKNVRPLSEGKKDKPFGSTDLKLSTH